MKLLNVVKKAAVTALEILAITALSMAVVVWLLWAIYRQVYVV
jgi:hypothetical protein